MWRPAGGCANLYLAEESDCHWLAGMMVERSYQVNISILPPPAPPLPRDPAVASLWPRSDRTISGRAAVDHGRGDQCDRITLT